MFPVKKIYRSFFASLFLLILSTPAFAADADSGVTAWMLVSTVLVLLMIPGLALFYGGLVRTKNVLGSMMHSFAAMAIIGVLWVACGYSMAFGEDVFGGWFGWSPHLLFLDGIDGSIMTAGVPEYVFAMFQGKFAIITPALIAGAFAERIRFWPYCIFIALWSLFVYNPLCHWVWYENGFLFKLGAIDFAGGTVVHIAAGISGLVAALYLGKRIGYPKSSMRPNNLVFTLIGAGLLWVGWFGFNAGSSIASNLQTAQAFTATQVAAASAALMWIFLEGIFLKKATSLGIASGIIAGLVAITPAAGVVKPLGAMALGALASLVCYGAIMLKNRLGYDDTLDVFGIHGTGGILGALGLSFFIRGSTAADLKAAALSAGTEWSVLHQFGVQALGVGVTLVYASAMTLLFLFVIDKCCGLRLDPASERSGLDYSQHGESAYGLMNPE
ncbi:MAG: ammonia channel protein [Deltaproteobacteria bacterium CG_4_10_14_0_2_um_filter_43_8]|nr:MAG: ammonia channel protein [Deltaproteobacteria bacterium CG11_big_fil_rev_8_21_14_0_20_42_23]PJA22274.1 MAG: ammonia channel protein [Deltaproteobacteria bacterium CG_4_10_14_0_2_um_filter_43_8]PJC63515.1 MAG: ammonia channel protein [Deltaproteobacteria bacterium CG_4_9_14_0_2_um_filter_42_21]